MAVGSSTTLRSRGMHVAFAAATVALYYLTARQWPNLVKDATTAFGTIGVFITLYGVVFTIIKVLRTKAAAEFAAQTAAKTARRVEALHDMRDAAECQILIENALERLREDNTMSPSLLGRIVKLYVAEFSITYEQETSPHRARVGVVNSFALMSVQATASRQVRYKKLITALVDMIADLSASNSRRSHEDST